MCSRPAARDNAVLRPQKIENVRRLLDFCVTSQQPWQKSFFQMLIEGRKFDVRLTWREGFKNKDSVKHVVKIYRLDHRDGGSASE